MKRKATGATVKKSRASGGTEPEKSPEIYQEPEEWGEFQIVKPEPGRYLTTDRSVRDEDYAKLKRKFDAGALI